jgi:predicted dehydrogenase
MYKEGISMSSTNYAHGFSRRGFLFQAAALSTGALYSKTFAATITPSACVTLGFIGAGNRATQMLPVFLNIPDIRILATCDVRRENRQRAKATADAFYGNKDCTAYRDCRELLARQDIDAVYIATGDRWHAQMSILAMQAGKDVYCEKPTSLSVQEAEALKAAALRYGRIYQGGCQRRNVGNFMMAIELAKSGRLGKLQTLHAGMAGMGTSEKNHFLPTEPEPDMDELDWNTWVGPAPWRPFNKGYLQSWKNNRDYHGDLSEWGCHTVDLCLVAAGRTRTAPTTYFKEEANVLSASFDDKLKIVMRSKGFRSSCAVRFEGEEGWVETDDSGDIAVSSPALLGNRKVKTENWTRPVAHPAEFIACVKSRLPTSAPAEDLHFAHVCCHAATIAYYLGRPLEFDVNALTFKKDPEASRSLYRPCRAPWRI